MALRATKRNENPGSPAILTLRGMEEVVTALGQSRPSRSLIRWRVLNQ
jgi:hypothetical protein